MYVNYDNWGNWMYTKAYQSKSKTQNCNTNTYRDTSVSCTMMHKLHVVNHTKLCVAKCCFQMYKLHWYQRICCLNKRKDTTACLQFCEITWRSECCCSSSFTASRRAASCFLWSFLSSSRLTFKSSDRRTFSYNFTNYKQWPNCTRMKVSLKWLMVAAYTYIWHSCVQYGLSKFKQTETIKKKCTI